MIAARDIVPDWPWGAAVDVDECDVGAVIVWPRGSSKFTDVRLPAQRLCGASAMALLRPTWDANDVLKKLIMYC